MNTLYKFMLQHDNHNLRAVQHYDSAGMLFSPAGDNNVAAQYYAPACSVQTQSCAQRHLHPVHGDAHSTLLGAASAMRACRFIYT